MARAKVRLGPPREPFPDREIAAADGQEPGFRAFAVETGRDREDRGGPKRMAHGRHRPGGLDRRERERPAQTAGGVDEDDDIVAGAGQGILDVELVVGVAREAPIAALLQQLGRGGPQAVVAAPGVADPQDEHPQGPGRSAESANLPLEDTAVRVDAE